MSGQHNDSRMNIALIMTAVQQGAVVANHVEVTELHKDHTTRKIHGARVQDRVTGKEWNVRAKVSRFLLPSTVQIVERTLNSTNDLM